ncbi:phage tail tip fiber protein [Massilia scottii]|uniref:phage tail tip fiber protein n=1 Tax=Massilia scottii TaxID=3057166 RepID=UPI002796A944|nr:DUF1983 domain-containing protein [Massilia sp. CCM 9029]MDQ1835075.1 DUF1983 domain-containing protein [Massilia sp. CCM 9029]
MTVSVPPISTASILAVKDPQTREVLRAMASGIAVRNGDVGSGDDAFLTLGDLQNDPSIAGKLAKSLAGPIIEGVGKPGSPMFDLAEKLQDKIMASPAWINMFSAVTLIQAPASVPGSASWLLQQEAKARGAAVTRVDTVIKETNLSLAKTTETLTSSIGAAGAAIKEEREVRSTQHEAMTQYVQQVVTWTNQSFVGVQNELTTRTNNDNALASAINTMWARVGLNQALVQTGTQIAVNPVGSALTKFEQLQATVTDPATGLVKSYAALRQEVNLTNDKVQGLSGKWGVKLDLNGYIAGVTLNSNVSTGGKAESSFIVLADTFAVGAPGRPGIVPFAIDARTGLVAVRGDLVAQGSITGYQLGAYSISRDKLALKVVGGAQIDDLAVDTLKIGNNAVTVPLYLSGTGSGGISAGTTRMVGQITAYYPAEVDVVALVTWKAAAWNIGGNTGVILHVDGRQFHYQSDSNINTYALSHATSARVRLSQGYHTFTITFDNAWHQGTYDLGDWSVTLLGVMK